mmetsp:Transcript_85533/g.169745  ORF Transcript_85533/g.169745 Transcript_85533/m.169745 type:complete len:228 (+) Transcript_85533:70-753(+)
MADTGDAAHLQQPEVRTDAAPLAKAVSSTASAPPPMLELEASALADGVNIHGWNPLPEQSGDENGIDLALMVARSSNLKGGSMGCVLSSPTGKIVAATTNTSLWEVGPHRRPNSDVHAEVNAIGACARRGIPTQGLTAYITMPPCRKCFIVLSASGVRRIVTRKKIQDLDGKDFFAVARREGLDIVVIEDSEERRMRLDRLANKRKHREDEPVPSEGAEPVVPTGTT